jgi:hypothetical protein
LLNSSTKDWFAIRLVNSSPLATSLPYNMIFLILLFIVALTNISAASIGTIDKGKIDKFENAYAIVTREDKVISVNKIGFKILKNDHIKTFRRSSLQIRFNDNTLVKLGKKTTLKVESFFYSKKYNLDNKVKLKIANGSYQIKTGKIGETSPQNFKIKTKFSTIGLRG